ncbi:PREDICTED: protein POLAR LOCALIZATION DURING ASYMMETRIC DIVISION AND REDISTRIBUTION-like isoform X2 [Camelina sativa]|uniref:Protein POLAR LOCALIZATION DURING ASYMMETRIC DIVISION AND REDISTRIBUTION-like isoform X2 n=1 Tax=Camelina sativa TaxID=90675 RepID=A0ABM0XVY0_CAMSA|nr:PREDICTED: protein POLAR LOCALIZATION DURING ASYMMETRIC DIVISION AND REDISTRIBUTION-like isoform X2 [Camelina sativa]
MDEGGEVRAGCIRIRFPSPRRIVSRWFSPHERKVKGKKTGTAEARVSPCDDVRIKTCSEDDVHLGVLGQSSDSTPRTIDSSELQRREFLFSIGLSCYLLHLIATGREEIHKIVELRNDLEKVLERRNEEELRRKQQEFVQLRNDIEKFLEFHNDDLRRKQREIHFGKQEKSEISAAYSTISDVVDGPESSTTDQYYSPQILETSMSVEGEGSLSHYVFKRGDDFGGDMDQLEAELEAEFELLQIGQGHDGQCSNLKEVSEKSEEDSEGTRFGHACPVLAEEQQGVCPYELERRLHELMKTRQEEEIKELEIALEDAKQRLQLKKTEASWWKDTAYIVSERIPEPSSRIIINSSSRTHPYPVSR